jgi:phosphomevalonate kinase
MRVEASAPGKIVLCGDYAVLQGAPAVVLALQRRARVTLEPRTDGRTHLRAPEIGVPSLYGRWILGHLHWRFCSPPTFLRLRLVTTVLERQARLAQAAPTLDVDLDTAAFFARHGAQKLGLGSSAALTVALSAALARAAGGTPPTLADLVALHRGFQSGRGSGIDIAASLHGGTLVYQWIGGKPQAQAMQWPAPIGLCIVWSGRSASTAGALGHLARWVGTQGERAARVFNGLGETAVGVTKALELGRIADMLDGLGVYAQRLQSLGEACGIDIMSAEHRQLARLARTFGVVYKSCGAGGGDVGVALSTDPERLAGFKRAALAQGFEVVNTGIDPHGLQVEAIT